MLSVEDIVNYNVYFFKVATDEERGTNKQITIHEINLMSETFKRHYWEIGDRWSGWQQRGWV